MASKKALTNRLKSLGELENVEVGISPKGDTVRVQNQKHHALSFRFKWSVDHFIGYFVDSDGNESQAVVSLYELLDAAHFVTSFCLLSGLRAKQKS